MLTTLRHRNFALLWFGGLVSMIGNWVLQIALPFYVYQLTGSALATGLMFIAGTVPRVLLGSIAGVFADRWDRQRTLVRANLLLSLLLLLLLLVRAREHLWIVYLLAVLQASIAQFIGPAEHALLPRLVSKEHLQAANALNALNNNLAMLIGPALGGVLMEWLGLTIVVIIDSLSYLVAAVLIGLISRSSEDTHDRSTTSGQTEAAVTAAALGRVWRDWQAGLKLVRHDRLVATIFIATGMVALGEGIFSVLLIPFLHLLGGGAQEFGWLATIRGVGGLLGGLVVGQMSALVKPQYLFPVCLMIAGVLGVVMFNVPVLLVAMAMLFLWGLPAMGAQVSVQTLLQSNVANQYQGRVFGAYGTTAALLVLCGQGLASGFGDHLGIVAMLNIDAILYLGAGVIALVLMRNASREREQLPSG
jgi:MFS family permease